MKSLRKNNLLIIILFVITILMSVGFAIISTTLNINGTAKVKSQTWDIHFENVNITEGSVEAIKEANIANDKSTLVEYEIELSKPGDFYEFTVDAVNDGTLDSMIEMVTLSGIEGNEEYVSYQATYLSGEEIKIGDALNASTSETYKVRIEYKKDIENLPSEDIKVSLVFGVTYSQGNDGEVITNYYTLTGIVYDTEGQPMTSGEVEVHSKVIKAPINSDGTYILKNVPVGKHEIIVKNETGEVLKEDTFTLSSGETTTTDDNEIIVSENSQPEINILVNKGVEITVELPKHTINIISENGETKELKVTKGNSENISVLPEIGYKYSNMTCTTDEDIKYNEETQELEIVNINENTVCNITFVKRDDYYEGPVVTLSQNGTSEYQKEVSTKVDIETKIGNLKEETIKYIVSDNKDAEATEPLTNGQDLTISQVSGIYYIIVESCNSIDVCSRFVSEPFYLDNEAPTITYGTDGSSTYAMSHTTTVEASDSYSQVNTLKYITGTSNTATPSTDLTNSGTVTISGVTGDYYVVTEACDKAGNCTTLASNVFKMDNTKPTATATVSGKSASIVLKDGVALAGYQVTTSASATSYTVISGTNKSVTYTATAAGTYYVHVKDSAGNTYSTTFTIASSAFCAYNVGQTWNYAYTGGIQSFTTPCNGTYKLEVWGAQGGQSGGNGGYAVGNQNFTYSTKLYVVVGGAGTTPVINAENAGKTQTALGGYNGGGNSTGSYPSSGTSYSAGSGGGATHIGNFNSVLATHGSKSGLYIVAGGGGGGGRKLGWYGSNYSWESQITIGGAGGGTTGLDGKVGIYTGDLIGHGGTQTAGGSGYFESGTFGKGGGGGGGGLYGGGGGSFGNSSGGGSGYIGGVIGGSMTSGQRSGHGYARITLTAISN